MASRQGTFEKRIDVINETVNESNNTSDITIALYFRRTDFPYWGYNREGTAWYGIEIKNTPFGTGQRTWIFDHNVGQNVWIEVARETFRNVPHDQNGDLSFIMRGDMFAGNGVSPTPQELGGNGQIEKAYYGKHIDRNVRITQFEKNSSTSGTNVGFSWATSDNIDALHLYDGDTKLQEFTVSGKSGNISYTVTPNRNYRFQIRVKKSGTNLWTNSGFIEHALGYPTITGDFNFNINSPINLYFTGTTPPSSVYLYVNSKDDSNYIAERTHITTSSVSINLTAEQKNKIYQKAGQKDWITMVVVQNLHLDSGETPYQQYSGTMHLNVSGTAPTFSNYSYRNTNSTISNIIGNKALADVACMQVQISTSNKAHSSVSTISKYVCTVSGGSNGFSRTVEANESSSDVLIDLGALPDSGYYNLSVYAVDARGIQSSPVTKQNAFEVLPYHVPLVSEFELKRQGNFEQEIDLHIKCSVAKVGGKNTSFSVSYRERKSGTENWESWKNINNISSAYDTTDYIKTINITGFITLDKSESYDFQFKFKDRFSEVIINPDVAQAIAPLSIFEDGTVAINRVPDFNQTDRAKLQIDGDIMVKKDSDHEPMYIVEEIDAIKKSTGNIDIKKLYLEMHPVGSIVMTTDPESPKAKFGGTWIQWGNGRVPVGVSMNEPEFSTVEKTGGEKAHTLINNEMPEHDHSLDSTGQAHAFSWGGGRGTVHAKVNAEGGATPGNTNYLYTMQNNWNHVDSQGGGRPHNNLQPYITCYMWKRTA